MNIGADFFNEILANIIQQHIERIISHDYVTVTPGIPAWFNIQKAINLSCIINRIKENHLIISTDVKRACDPLTEFNNHS